MSSFYLRSAGQCPTNTAIITYLLILTHPLFFYSLIRDDLFVTRQGTAVPVYKRITPTVFEIQNDEISKHNIAETSAGITIYAVNYI